MATYNAELTWHTSENGSWAYLPEAQKINEYASWLKQVPWSLFGTFTFPWRPSDFKANTIFAEFMDQLECRVKADVGYLRGDEKRISGCGKPDVGLHYHALLACAAPVNPHFVEWLWTSIAGDRSDGAGAKVEPYDNSKNGVYYVLKMMNREGGEWQFRKLHLFHPTARSLQPMNKRFRRLLDHHRQREQKSRDGIAAGGLYPGGTVLLPQVDYSSRL